MPVALQDADALIAHILTRHRPVHRQEVPVRCCLAGLVEAKPPRHAYPFSWHAVVITRLCRQLAGTNAPSPIVKRPGKPSAVAACLAAVFPAIADRIDLIGGPRVESDPGACVAVRPKGA